MRTDIPNLEWEQFNKLRTDKAVVLSIGDADSPFGRAMKSELTGDSHISDTSKNGDLEYVVGEVVEPENPLDPDILQECTSGIHFFPTKREAQYWH